jgi:hypothetical protein
MISLIWSVCALLCIPYNWASCHHGMSCPQITDGGGGLQMCRGAANMLNNLSQIAEKGDPPACGLRGG